MGVYYETIPPSLIKWVVAQNIFWVATAPLSGNGHVNVSPKGGKYFDVVDERTFWYLDLSGSGNETISHLLEPGNGRITIQFNAFDGPPKIVRFWGKGRVLEHGTSQFTAYVQLHSIHLLPGTRSIIVVDIHQVGSSCGFSVPYFDFKEFRPILNDLWAKRTRQFHEGKTNESMERYWAYKNAYSMDGLPGMQRGLLTAKEEKVAPIVKMIGPLAPVNRDAYGAGMSSPQILLVVLLSFLMGVMAALYAPVLMRVVQNTNMERFKAGVSHISLFVARS